jgi:hypothetical protein
VIKNVFKTLAGPTNVPTDKPQRGCGFLWQSKRLGRDSLRDQRVHDLLRGRGRARPVARLSDAAKACRSRDAGLPICDAADIDAPVAASDAGTLQDTDYVATVTSFIQTSLTSQKLAQTQTNERAVYLHTGRFLADYA